MEKIKRLGKNFQEVSGWKNVHYVVYENGDVELCTPYDTAYPVITRDEILKLAEILEEEE